MSAPYGGQPNQYPPYNEYGSPPPYNPNYGQNQQGYYPQQPNYGPSGQADHGDGRGYQTGYPQQVPVNPPPSAMGGLRGYTPEDVMEDNTDLSRFSDKSIRRAFVRKVYLIVTGQLLFTLAFVILFSVCEPIKKFLIAYSWVYYIAYGIFFVTYIVLICVGSVRRKVPLNFICLSIFTAAFTYMTATISGFYDTKIVLIALAITVVVCVGITIFAMQTKIDFTMCSGLMFVLGLVLLLFGIAVALTFAFAKLDQRTAMILQCVYGSLCALVFSLYLIFDTQLLLGDKKNAISEEEYIYAALQLYMDMVQIFLAILQIVGAVSK